MLAFSRENVTNALKVIENHFMTFSFTTLVLA